MPLVLYEAQSILHDCGGMLMFDMFGTVHVRGHPCWGPPLTLNTTSSRSSAVSLARLCGSRTFPHSWLDSCRALSQHAALGG